MYLLLPLILSVVVVFSKPAREFHNKNEISTFPKFEGYAWEHSGLFEGDIMIRETEDGIVPKNVNLEHIWPYGYIPYEIRLNEFSALDVQVIQQAMAIIEAVSCVRFGNRGYYDRSYVVISGDLTDERCFSSVGRTGNDQKLQLGPRCRSLGTVLHELLHLLGLDHQQNAHNRDDYVIIHWENIIPEEYHEFKQCKTCTDFGLGYDYYSIMHYSAKAFSKNGYVTMSSKNPYVTLDQRQMLSIGDAEKIKLMYNC